MVDADTGFHQYCRRSRAFPGCVVGDDGRVTGVLFLGDIALAPSSLKGAVVSKPVGEIMTSTVCSARLGDRVTAKMASARGGRRRSRRGIGAGAPEPKTLSGFVFSSGSRS